MTPNNAGQPQQHPPEPDDGPVVSFKLVVTVVVSLILIVSVYLVYAGATGKGNFRQACEGGKGKRAKLVLGELGSIGATIGEPSANKTVIAEHPDGARCVVRVTGDRVFSAIYEE